MRPFQSELSKDEALKASIGGGLNDPGRVLELAEERLAMAIGNAGVNGRRADGLMAEVILDEFQRDAGLEQVRGNRMTQAVGGVPAIEAGAIAISREQRLDLTLAEWTGASREERRGRDRRSTANVLPEKLRGARKERLHGPGAALEPLDDDSTALEVDILPLKQRDLRDAKAVVINQREERAVAKSLDRTEEGADFELAEVARKAGPWPDEARHRREWIRE